MPAENERTHSLTDISLQTPTEATAEPSPPNRNGNGGACTGENCCQCCTDCFGSMECEGCGHDDQIPCNLLRVIYFVGFVIGMIITIIQIVEIGCQYFEKPTPVTAGFTMNYAPLDMPDITICPSNMFNVSQVNRAEHKIGCNLQALILNGYLQKYRSPECASATYHMNENLTRLCDRYFWFCDGTRPDQLDYNGYFARKHLVLYEALRNNSGNASDYFIKVWTMGYGNCFTLNMSRNMRVFEAGVQSGLDMTFYLGNLNMDGPMPLDLMSYRMRVVIHQQGTRPLPGSDGFSVGVGSETFFAIQPQMVSFEYIDDRPCGNGEIQTGYKTYSVKACHTQCYENKALEECGCTDPFARTGTPSRDAKICDNVDGYKCNFQLDQWYSQTVNNSENFCNCAPSCNDMQYKITTSKRRWPEQDLLSALEFEACRRSVQNAQDCTKVLQNRSTFDRMSMFLRLKVYLMDLEYQHISVTKKYTCWMFMSDIGGALGLWVGLSIAGALQGILFCCNLIRKYCCCRCCYPCSCLRETCKWCYETTPKKTDDKSDASKGSSPSASDPGQVMTVTDRPTGQSVT